MMLIILSDLHLGKGKYLKNGQVNIMEDFEEDERFGELLDYYSSNEFEDQKVDLVLNGDILNLIQIDIDGVYTTEIDEKITVEALEKIIKGHPLFFSSLKKFAEKKNKTIYYTIGNHDNGMAFLEAQNKFKQICGNNIVFGHSFNIQGVHIEHGHRFEAINQVPLKKFFLTGEKGQPILNLPWGSLFCISILPALKKSRPNIDKVRPLPVYIQWCLIHDFFFFLRMAKTVILYFLKTYFENITQRSSAAKINFKILKEITIYPNYERQARRILKRHPEVHTVVMGHTHITEIRKFSDGKTYLNCGTWNPLFSLDKGQYENSLNLSYVLIRFNPTDQKVLACHLNKWQGQWRPYLEIAEI